MPVFAYKALQTDGTAVEGELEARGRQEALRQIGVEGMRPVRLSERSGASAGTNKSARSKLTAKPAAREKSNAKNSTKGDSNSQASLGMSFQRRGKVTPRMLENFTRLLSSLLAAGVPLSRALTILQREAANPAAKEKWKGVYDSVVDGVSLTEAMARSPETFPKVYVAMVEAGETGGFLDVVLAQIADFQAREKEMKSKVMTALLYPVILLVLALGVLIFLLVFFIPRFQTIFEGFGAELPLLTQMIIGASELLRTYGLFIGGKSVV